MAQIVIELSDKAKEAAETEAKQLGFDTAADWCFEWLRNTVVQRVEEKAHTALRKKGPHREVAKHFEDPE